MPPVIPKKDPLLTGEKTNWSIYGTKALKKELERQSQIDGYESVAPYMVDLLVAALRAREAERRAEQTEIENALKKQGG